MAYVRYSSEEERSAARAKAYADKLEWLKQPEGRRYQLNARMRTLYGITLEQYESYAEAQNHMCKLCGLTAEENTHGRLYVDHCHITGAYRGLLCNKCNSGLGKFNDNIEVLERALAYLKETR